MSDYVKCSMCKEGRMLPFFMADGRNVYACTECKTIFYLKVPSGAEGDPWSWKANYTLEEDFSV